MAGPVVGVTSESLALVREACADARQGDSGCDAWAALHFLCPEAAPGAAEILDSKIVTRVVARESRRTYFLVEAGKGTTYSHVCFPGFCTCDHYRQRVASRTDTVACKHEIAVLLAEALSLMQQRELSDEEWAAAFDTALSLEQ